MATWWSIKDDEAEQAAPASWTGLAVASAVILLAGVYLLTPLRVSWMLDSYAWLRQFLRLLLVHGM
jgi:hypothetical protein